jgi:hypothetical protein
VLGYVVARYPHGPAVPGRLDLSLRHPLHEDGRPRPFTIDWLDGRGDPVLHVSARPDDGVAVLNGYRRGRLRGGSWGDEVALSPYPFPRDGHHQWHLGFELLADRFRVLVEREPLCDFPHRTSPGPIRLVRSSSFVFRLEDGLQPAEPEFSPAWDHGWIRAEPNREPQPLESFRFFAVLGTWLEEDVVEATVASCFRQGCERVYLVDNGSPDRTVERAVAAGAIHARSFTSDDFDERERMRQLQSVVDEVSQAEGDEHVWWLYLDADEFYRGPGALTLREHLATLDRRYRVVGSRLFNHLPGGEPAYVEGRHPLDYQPLCYPMPAPWWCSEGHWRHPLLRWDRGGPPITVGQSFHTSECAVALLEPPEPVTLHHFPFRSEEVTRRRLERLFGRGEAGADRTRADQQDVVDHMRRRLASLDAVYRGRYADAEYQLYPRAFVPRIRPWEDWAGPEERTVPRWY